MVERRHYLNLFRETLGLNPFGTRAILFQVFVVSSDVLTKIVE